MSVFLNGEPIVFVLVLVVDPSVQHEFKLVMASQHFNP